MEDTPNGQNTFHGTVIVINQHAEDGDHINQPLIIPDKILAPAPLKLEIKYLPEQIIKTKPIRFPIYQLGNRNDFISKDFTHTWAMTNLFASYHGTKENTNGNDMENPEQQEVEQEQMVNVKENVINVDESILEVKDRSQNDKKLATEEVMPTWAATKS